VLRPGCILSLQARIVNRGSHALEQYPRVG